MITVTANQILAHLIGDYILQSDWMARNKTTNLFAAIVHGLFYSIPFLILIPDITFISWLIITTTHIIIDNKSLASYVIRFRNLIGGNLSVLSKEHTTRMGMPKSTPEHIQFFVFVLVDNTLHITINALALSFL